ncbi:MAG: uroporphyrinogen decarboxylase family protein, partial [Eubacteriales bacterium]|nr:uroporphyrinogen decarboxylase family protein [Eubacteriales bacterium]
RGTKLFMDMKRNPEHVKQLMDYCTEQAIAMNDMYVEAGCHVLGPVDPLVSQISSKHFEEFLSEPYTRIFEHIRQQNRKSCFFVCGNAERNLEVMCETKPDNISIDENIPMDKAKAITDQYNVTIGGNIPLTTTMLFGNQQDNMKFVVDMVDSVDSSKNLVVSPGCDMPYDIPVENSIAVAEAVRDIDKYRDLLKDYESDDLGDDVELPDYDKLERPLIEVFTLDSASCAACTYMWAAAQDATKEYGDKVDVIEYKYTDRAGLSQIKAMGVQNLPSLYIDGELYYASIIPSNEEYFAAIDKVMEKYK